MIQCPAEPDIFWSDRYRNRNAEEKIISAALKGLYLKDSAHFFIKTAQKGALYRQVFYSSRLFPGGIKNPQVKETQKI